MKYRTLFTLMLLGASSALFAAGGGGHGGDVEKDFVERLINFLMFFGIVYYLAAKPVKQYFINRTQGIADELEKVQQKLKESKKLKEDALARRDRAKEQAEEMISMAKKEAMLIKERAHEQQLQEGAALRQQYQDRMELEKKQVQRHLVKQALDELFEEGSLSMDERGYAQIILKKVA